MGTAEVGTTFQLHHKFPLPINMAGWKEIPIQPVSEIKDPLVSLNDCNPKIRTEAQYYKLGLPGTSEVLFARRSVTQRLTDAAELLPIGLCLVIWDPYRSVITQQSLFDIQYAVLSREHPDWDKSRLSAETQRYVSLPSVDPTRPSPHLTGGAIDLTICDNLDIPLDMGTNFDHFGPEAATNYFTGDLSGRNCVINTHRLLLHWVMTQVGFSNYHEEWWHFDYGNQFWAKTLGKDYAIFGPAFINNLTS